MIKVVDLDFSNEAHVEGLLRVLSTYSAEAGGGGQSIAEETKNELSQRLNAFPGRHVFLALDNDQPVGVAVCLTGFSTFKAQPVLNVHDLAVLPSHRGQGLGSALLSSAEARARELGCCKVTLEVIETNEGARRLYERSGFGAPTKKAVTFFMEKKITA